MSGPTSSTPLATADSELLFRPRLAYRRAVGRAFAIFFFLTSLIAVVGLIVLIARILQQGWPALSWTFLSSFPSQLDLSRAGIKAALAGTIWTISLTALVSVPIGIGAAIFLEEYSSRSRLMRLIELNIANLAGVPSIVYGMLGLTVFVRWFGFGRSVISGALALALLVLPVIIIAARESLRAVPGTIREAAFALGATRWQAIRHHVLPAAMPGIMTGVILALSRAIGEAAPLIVIGAPVFLRSVPSGPFDVFTALPLQIYHWAENPGEDFSRLAAAGIIVLLAVLLSMNAMAVAIRTWHQRHRVW